jgi:3-hydroxymyristoyl/3-hydroxydecanoyl-(acyl carrier protein) dehydratase
VVESGWIEGEALKEYVPHRGVNILLDAVRVEGAGDASRAEGRISVSPGDALGRDVFLRQDAAGGSVIMGPALVEHLALCAIYGICSEMEPDDIAFFSRIADFKLERELRAGEPVRSEDRRLRDKGRFRRFVGELRDGDGELAASAEIMAYIAPPGSTSERGESGKLVAPPEVREVRAVERSLFGWKRPEMVFIDERVDISPDKTQATLRYTYPADHPFCAGHFPGNPVMMGITQWIAAADAATWLLFERAEAGLEEPGPRRRGASVEIMRSSGGLVAEVRGLVLLAEAARGGIPPPRLEKTRRIGFRDQVRPGETIFMRVRLAAEE